MGTARRLGRAASLALAACLVTRALAAPSIADFASDTDFATPTLSPDGTKVAFVARVQDRRLLMVLDLIKRERRALMPATADSFEISYCSFKSDERILCGLRGTAFQRGLPYPISRLVAIDASGKTKGQVLIQNSDYGSSQFQDRVLDWQIDDPRHVLIELSSDGDPFPNVHSLNIYTGLSTVVQRSRSPIMSWTTDRNGVVRFGEGFDERKHFTYVTRDSAEASWRTLAKWELYKEEFEVVGFGPTPGTLLVRAEHNGRSAIFELDLAEKSDKQLLFANSEVDVGGPIYWPADRRIIGFSYETDRRHRRFFDEKAENIYAAIDAMLPGADNSVIDSSRDSTKLLVSSRADVRPTEYYVLDLGNKKLLKIGSANPSLAKEPMAEMKSIRIKGPDGQMLPGYLTLPPGSNGKNLKTIVYPHGGPHARDHWGFDEVVQFMASRGFAVVQVNFRGSVGYGEEWFDAGLRNWGTVMVDDITAATKWAIAEGVADPARTCIVGWSYGGYAALMSAVRESELYKCVVSIAGVSDLRALAREDARFYGGRQAMEHILGTDTDELKAGSPTRSAARIRAPVLMIHGDNDFQVDVDHSRRMARALGKENKKFELVIIKDGNHSLSRFEWRETLFTKLEAFLAANN